MTTESTATPEVAMNEWYAKYDGRSDSPTVYVNFPSSLPDCNLETVNLSSDPHGRMSLPEGRIWATLRVAGIAIRAPLEDLELLWAAAGETIQRARYIATQLQNEQES